MYIRQQQYRGDHACLHWSGGFFAGSPVVHTRHSQGGRGQVPSTRCSHKGCSKTVCFLDARQSWMQGASKGRVECRAGIDLCYKTYQRSLLMEPARKTNGGAPGHGMC